MTHLAPALLALCAASAAFADPPVIKAATATPSGDSWRFSVTLFHADTGWEDYADGWRVEAKDGTILGTRVLHHPHVNEQPFTRALSGVALPKGTGTVYIRARESVGGWADDRYAVALPQP